MGRHALNPLPERVALGLTQKQFAEKIGFSEIYMKKIEAGIRPKTPAVCLRIAAINGRRADLVAMVDKFTSEFREKLLREAGL